MNQIFRTAQSPTDLMRAVNVAPPSEMVETLLDAWCGTRPTARQRQLLAEISRMPWPTAQPNECVHVKGRRGHGTTAGGWIAAYDATSPELDEYAPPGARVFVIWVCPTLAQAREATHATKMALDALESLGVRYDQRGVGDSVEITIRGPVFATERVISIRPANDVAGRGLAIPTLIFDEVGFLPSSPWLQLRDEGIIRAYLPAGAQFKKRRRVLYITSPGAPGSYAHKLATKPPAGCFLTTASTWQMNPRLTREECWALAHGDEPTFRIEYEVSRWGLAGENFVDSAAAHRCIDQDGKYTPKGLRRFVGAVLAIDKSSSGRDQTTFTLGWTFEEQIAPGKAPVRHLVIEHIEAWSATKDQPILSDGVADHGVSLAKACSGIPIVCDGRDFADVSHRAEKVGAKIAHGTEEERRDMIRRGGLVIVERPMHPAAQSPRWAALRDLVHGGRLHLPATREGEAAARQIAELKATALSSGWLRVEGKQDDLADAIALLAEACMLRAPDDIQDGILEYEGQPVLFEPGEGLKTSRGRWIRKFKDGRPDREEEWPRWHRDFPFYMRECLANGQNTPACMAALTEMCGRTPTQEDVQRFLDSPTGLVGLEMTLVATEPVRPVGWAAMQARPRSVMGPESRRQKHTSFQVVPSPAVSEPSLPGVSSPNRNRR